MLCEFYLNKNNGNAFYYYNCKSTIYNFKNYISNMKYKHIKETEEDIAIY